MATVQVATAQAMEHVGRALAGALRAGDLVLLNGPLGAGKTTLARGIGAGLGVRGPIASPTFIIARTHPSEVGGPDLVHVDAYRLGSLAEIDHLDLDTSLDDAVTLVEWGEGKAESLASSRLLVVIDRERGMAQAPGDSDMGDSDMGGGDIGDGGLRTVTITGEGERWVGLEFDLPADPGATP